MEKIGENYQKTLKYIKKKLDTSIKDFKTRNEIVIDIINKCPYLRTYWETKTHKYNRGNYLEAESPYGMLVSRLTNYLLMSDESKEMSRKEKTVYVFTDEYMKRKINRESITVSENGSVSNILDSVNFQIIKQPITSERNYIKKSLIKIYSSDLNKNTYESKVLTDYQKIIDRYVKKIRDKSYNRRLLNWQLHTLREDQRLAKKMLKGYFGESIEKYFQFDKKCDIFDWRDNRTLLKLLQMRGDFYGNYEVWLTCFDLQCLLDRLDLTDDEDKIRKMLYKGFSFKDIEYFTGFTYNQIYYGIVQNIITKIQKQNIPYDVEVNPIIIDKIEKRNQKKLEKIKRKEHKNDKNIQFIY